MTAFATVYGLPVHDTELHKKTTFFNCEKLYHEEARVMAAPPECVVFHPVKDVFDFKELLKARAKAGVP